MPRIQRVGDANSAGGVIQKGDPSVLVNGRAIALVDAPVSPHPPCGRRGGQAHCSARTQSASNGTVLVNGKQITLSGSKDTCGHDRSTGSADVGIG
jgi:uncharacterized Zn-binding protein involved in type VI secretion